MSKVEGAISVKAALESRYRKVEEVFIAQGKSGSDISYIKQLAARSNVRVTVAAPFEIEKMASGRTHGGIIATVTERKFQSVTSLLKKEKPFLVLLEGIEDNYNLGYILRTLYAFGCNGVIMPARSFTFEDETLIKSSAGASELMPIHLSEDMQLTLETLRASGIRIVSAYRGGNCHDLYDYSLKNDSGMMIAIGGPLRGLSRTVLDYSDDFIYIPYANDFHKALNAASAVSVIAGEYYRSNREDK